MIVKPDPKFGNVTVEDLVIGSVETWIRSGNLNVVEGAVGSVDPLNRDDFQNLWDNGIRAPGHIRIPVCSPKEAWQLAVDGFRYLPKVNTHSYPCLADPNQGYTSPESPELDFEPLTHI
ncbi:hypothetical protein E4U21_004214 [Claviceps maximensis]|nr:hypothetical protein E4U21_004214 [Claviceps maximensis]